MKVSDFKTLVQDINVAIKGKELTCYLYGKHYQMNEPQREGARAFSLALFTDGFKIDYFELYDLKANNQGIVSYTNSKVKKTMFGQFTIKQRQAIINLFGEIKENH